MTCATEKKRTAKIAGAFLGLGVFLVPPGAYATDFKSPRLRNEGFEHGLSEWNGAGKGWRIVPGEGRVKSNALVCDGAAAAGPSQVITLDPGGRYRFGAWVRTKALDANGKPLSPKIVLTWYDWNNQPRGSVQAVIAGDNDPNPEGWVRYEGIAVPTCGPYGKISVAPPEGADASRIIFDDFYHILDGGKPVGELVTDAYRNKKDSGLLRLAVALNINTITHPLEKLRARFSFTGEDGKRFELAPAEFAADKALVEVPVERLRKGPSDVEFTLTAADGSVMGSARCTFFRASPGKRRVTFDEHNRTLVDGKPFFPLGMFISYIDEKMMDTYRKGPFNCVLTYDISDKALGLCASSGLMYIPSLIGCVAETRHAGKEYKNDRKASEAKIRSIVARLKSDPNLLAWYTCDESSPREIEAHRRATRLFHELDPDHPVYFVLDRPEHVRHFTPVFDVIGMDPYPIGNNRGGIDIAFGWADEARKGMYGFRPMWHVNQAYSWGWHHARKHMIGKNPDLRFPTHAEYSSMMWQAVAAGANGLIPYAFHHLVRDAKGEESTMVLKVVFDEMSVLKRYLDVLLSDPGPKVSGVPEALAVRTWRRDGRVWILVCNKTRKPVKADLSLDAPCRDPRAAVGPAAVCSGRTLSVDLPEIGVSLFSVAR